MITRARAPLRLGLAGGGTDLSPYCDEFGGAVLNCTIDRFAYAFIADRDDGKVAFLAHDLGRRETLDLAEVNSASLALHRGVYQRICRMFNGGHPLPLTITSTVDVPAGSGLGSSSALVVAMVDALRVHLDLPLGQNDVAHLAFEIERIDLGLSGGKQDQYAAAFGGINFIEFLADDRVVVNPLRVPSRYVNELETSLVICFSGQSRESAAIIDQQTAGMTSHLSATVDALHELKADAIEMKRAIFQGHVQEIGRILSRSWIAKKATARGVTNSHIDGIYDLAMRNGALGGKVSGAGGGGFMMFVVRPDDRLGLLGALNESACKASPVKFMHEGCETWQIAQ
ncbi:MULTISPECIES: GHMP family kinase ATP-binding protein [Methylobacterium]|uniref:D-glycero-alpha-D-manno-heptose 7-phosphate kinase n=1 Tax=Methylobacterium thuringiense TaxID=1003091 RepID=A0ABQ4TRJ0_9HYPH|nr:MULTISPECIES: GHMP kinase [Methylobacterium]GJE57916.1 D-glycero-alpha-D-manno-heptose 7-phosphate kinase [Methylobacterium thuringiense]